jgi:hypothetical protein
LAELCLSLNVLWKEKFKSDKLRYLAEWIAKQNTTWLLLTAWNKMKREMNQRVILLSKRNTT